MERDRKADKQRAGLLSCVNPTWVGRLLSIPLTSLGAWFSASREVMAEFYRYLGGLHSSVLLDQCLHFLMLDDCKASGAPAQGDTYPGSRTGQRLAGHGGRWPAHSSGSFAASLTLGVYLEYFTFRWRGLYIVFHHGLGP